ncbi:MAG: M6 family metalloprotease domain-containing protein [Gemmatimonadota bacterium]
MLVAPRAVHAQKALPFPAAAGEVSPPAAIAGLIDARPVAPLEFSRAWLAKVEGVRQKRAQLLAENQLDGLSPWNAARRGAALNGVLRVPVIPVRYVDVAEPFAASDLQRRLFGESAGDTITYGDYWDEVSSGLLRVEGEVTPWVTLERDARYYLPEAQFGWAQFGRTSELRAEALKNADQQIDFSYFDNDGPDGKPDSGDDDGYVDFVAIVYALPCPGNGRAGAIWPHRAAMAPFETNDESANGGKIRIADYVILPAVDPQSCGPMHIGVLAHETGHALGLPDLYDYDGSSQGIGSWGLMGTGSHSTRFSPAHLSAWEKEQLGWVRVNWLQGSQPITAPPIQHEPIVFRYDVPGTSEYVLLENRQRIGSDRYLPGHGLLAWRIDPERAELGAWNSDERRAAVSLIEADGRNDLATGGRADGSDPFPGALGHRLLRVPDVQTLRLTWIRERNGSIQAMPLVGYSGPTVVPERPSINMTALVGQSPAQHAVAIRREAGATDWSARSTAAWLAVETSTDSMRISANPIGMPPGVYVDTILLAATRGESSTKVRVELRVALPGVPEVIATELPWSWGLAARSGMLLQASYGWDALGLRPRPRVLQLWDGVNHPATLARIPADALYAPVIIDDKSAYVVARARSANYVYRIDASGNAAVVAGHVGDGPAYGAALMPDGALIVAEWSGKLHRVSPEGVVSSYGKLNAHLYQIATDASGNLYAATFEGTVIRMAPDGSSSVVTTGFEKGKLVAIAATPAGDLYVTERGDHGRIIHIRSDGGREVVLQRKGAQFYGVAVDEHFLYAIDLRNRELLRIPRDGAGVAPIPAIAQQRPMPATAP